jgi:hypothetical protein
MQARASGSLETITGARLSAAKNNVVKIIKMVITNLLSTSTHRSIGDLPVGWIRRQDEYASDWRGIKYP